ncbi:hypothetical protein DFH07DRAFT_386582 [Mycena maculata]|uniref:Uncharacterized protein n=1 Tax=Mycena maculata TaxID=230809 RepID=A0AAD7NZG4_9AGAR|nr:hypothetical protein DFH07DRAFT_386582 [Mycena maculata]
MIFNTLVSVLAIAVAASSTPIQPQQLDVITPHITSPVENDIWVPGENRTVTWNTTEIPPAFKNNTGKLVLGYYTTTKDDQGHWQTSENLNNTSPLAQNFVLGDGCANITVPHVPPRSTYIVVLFGDSGNASPQFKIAEK